MQLKFGLFSQKILPFVKEYYIFVISPSEKCGGINQPRLIYFWGEKKPEHLKPRVLLPRK